MAAAMRIGRGPVEGLRLRGKEAAGTGVALLAARRGAALLLLTRLAEG